MEGYVSAYQPGHIASGEAWNLAQADAGAIILDLQSEDSFNDYRVSGAVNVSYENLETYASANLTDKSGAIILYCFCGDRGGTALSGYNLLTGLGYTNVSYTEPGDEWVYEGESAVSHKIITGAEAKKIVDGNPEAILLDVRNQDEYDVMHIDGSVLIPVSELDTRLSELPDKNAQIIVYCRAGRRSEMAYGILKDAGYTRIYDMRQVDYWPLPLIKREG